MMVILLPIDHMREVDLSIQTPEAFGLWIRSQRKRLGLSQSEVADVIGVNRRVLGQLERGKPTVQLWIALRAAQAVGLDISLHARP
jgi:DNA-binding XRE family transcriptional regulator